MCMKRLRELRFCPSLLWFFRFLLEGLSSSMSTTFTVRAARMITEEVMSFIVDKVRSARVPFCLEEDR
jgi:hypothetical protein